MTEIKSFIGLAGYYRRFVQDFSKIVAPLIKLTRKGEKYIWTEECIAAFEQLKKRLITAPILKTPSGTGGMVISVSYTHLTLPTKRIVLQTLQ